MVYSVRPSMVVIDASTPTDDRLLTRLGDAADGEPRLILETLP